MVFPCDRRIWQSILFEKFVYNRNAENDNKPTVHIKKVQSWLKKHNHQIPIDWALTYRTTIQTSSQEYISVTLLYDVVFTFFNYLAYLGFLAPLVYQETEVKQTHSLAPPNKVHADILIKALKRADWYDPFVDNQLSQLITLDDNTKFAKHI